MAAAAHIRIKGHPRRGVPQPGPTNHEVHLNEYADYPLQGQAPAAYRGETMLFLASEALERGVESSDPGVPSSGVLLELLDMLGLAGGKYETDLQLLAGKDPKPLRLVGRDLAEPRGWVDAGAASVAGRASQAVRA